MVTKPKPSFDLQLSIFKLTCKSFDSNNLSNKISQVCASVPFFFVADSYSTLPKFKLKTRKFEEKFERLYTGRFRLALS